MYSCVQCVFLLDVNSIKVSDEKTENIDHDLSSVCLCVLRLLTEFGTNAERGIESVRWAFKYYDSKSFKSGTTRKTFIEFDKSSFDEFEEELSNKIKKNTNKKNEGVSKSHSFILKKGLQEVLLDFNWDSPDISSPVKPINSKSNKSKKSSSGLAVDNEPYNAVIVLSRVPHNQTEYEKFTEGTPMSEFTKDIMDEFTYKGFKDEKNIRLYFIDQNKENDEIDMQLMHKIHLNLLKLNGGYHSIRSIVSNKSTAISNNTTLTRKLEGSELLLPLVNCISTIEVSLKAKGWWKTKGSGRPRRTQPGPKISWIDKEGISFIEFQLEVMALHGR